MSKELGHAIDVHGHVLWTFPGPDRLAHLEKFPGLFGRKVEYLNALGRAALAGEVDTEALRAMPREAALKRLQRLPGIGACTWQPPRSREAGLGVGAGAIARAERGG